MQQVYWERLEAMSRWVVDVLQVEVEPVSFAKSHIELGPRVVATLHPGGGRHARGKGEGTTAKYFGVAHTGSTT